MRKILVLIILLSFLNACSEYQKVYNSEDWEAKYKMAWKMYENKKYRKADMLFSQIEHIYKRKPNYQRLLFTHAMSLYHQKYYVSAGEKFRKFTQLFPESSKAEEADFYIVKSYYNLSPKFSVDQSYTQRALEEIASFLKKYPFTKYKNEINVMNEDLETRLEKKYYEIALLYYHLERYKAAIRAFNNYFIDYPGSKFKEDALYYRFKAAADLAIKSIERKKENRLKTAIEYYNSFVVYAKNEKYKKDAEKVYTQLQKELSSYNNDELNISVKN